MLTGYPLISCICVTRGKPALLQIAINCFLGQTYPNKELIIVYEHDDVLTAGFIENAALSRQIKTAVLNRTPERKLGALRNYGIAIAAGEYIAQWDDDDWYHANRLKEQYEALIHSGKAGCVMTRWLVFDAVKGSAFISNTRLWEGSIVCRKKWFDTFQYHNVQAGEDTPVIHALYRQGCLHLMEDMPYLYIYIYHGNNTWNQQHWELLFKMGLPLPSKVGTQLRGIVHPQTDVAQGSEALIKLLADSKILIDDE